MRPAAARLALLSLLAAAGCEKRTEVVVFYASSLNRTLSDAAEAFQAGRRGVTVRLEPSGSQVAARKVAELGMKADLVAVADAEVIARILVPSHAAFTAVFATNEIVLAHRDHSRFTEEITSTNWPEVLSRDGVRLGRADPDLAPLGYHTLLSWALAERHLALPGLVGRLRSRCAPGQVTPDEAELVSHLEAKAVDYAFLFRSTAEDHHLKIVALPPETNLSDPDLAKAYAQVEVPVRMRQGEGPVVKRGGPITCGLTIPLGAPHPELARAFAAFLLGERGRAILTRAGLRPVTPAAWRGAAPVPEELSGLVRPEGE